MSEHDEILAQAIANISEGASVDWASLESVAVTESTRALVAELKIVARVADQARQSPAPDHHERPNKFPFTWAHLNVLEPIGHGAFGRVYRAWDSRLDRLVALKLLTDDVRKTDVRPTSIIAEGRLLARIRHPNVVTVYGAERVDNTVGIWMEFVRGRSLEQIVREDGPLEVPTAASIGIDLCRALAAVHVAGLVHRDVKATNVLREEGGRIVLADFGNGVEPASLDCVDGLAGTPLYLAPEILRGEPATPRSDLYSAGVLLFFLVTGSFPIDARTLQNVHDAHDHEQYRRLSVLRPELPLSFVTAIDRALSKRPADRFQTANDLAQALDAVVAGRQQSRGRSGIKFGALAVALAMVSLLLISPLIRHTRLSNPSDRVSRLIARPPCGGPPSADGQWVACLESPQSLRDRHAPLAPTLILFNTETGERRVLKTAAPDERILSAVISPDSTQIAYDLTSRTGGTRIQILRVNDASERQLTTLPADVASVKLQSWSIADGLLECRFWLRGAGHAFALLSPESGAVKRRFDISQSPQGISRSPHGDRLAFDVLQSSNAPERDIRVCEMSSNRCETLSHPANDFIPFWTPDGRLLFNSDRGRTIGIWGVEMVNLLPSGPAELILDLGRSWVSPFGFSRAGILFYSKRVGDFDVYTGSVDSPTGDITPVRLSSRAADMNKAPAWSPDGQWLAFVSQRGPFQEPGASRIVVRRTSDGTEREFVHEFQVLAARLAWSPDGRRLAFRDVQRGQSPSSAPIRLIDPMSGRAMATMADPNPLPEGHSLVDEFDWLDGSTLAFTTQSGIGVIDVDTGAWHMIWRRPAENGFFRVAVSPDHRSVATVTQASDRSWSSAIVIPSTGGEARELLRVTSPEVMLLQCWTADGSSLLVTRHDRSKPEGDQRDHTWRVPIDGGVATDLKLTGSGLQEIRAHPDGHQLALVFGGGNNEFWTVSGFAK
jgi:serine/threonine protein kinase